MEQTLAAHALGLRFSLDLPVRDEWHSVESLRTLVQRCMQAACAGSEAGEALAMVTSELLENALKYGAGAAPGAIRLLVSGGPEGVRITVQNPIRSAHEGGDAPLAELLRTIAWIAGFDAPADAYRARLLEIAASGDDWERDGGKLGLLRVAYEGNCTLSARIDGGLVSVTALMRM